MVIAEPTGAFWPEIRPHVQWPSTNEDDMARMADGWQVTGFLRDGWYLVERTPA